MSGFIFGTPIWAQKKNQKYLIRWKKKKNWIVQNDSSNSSTNSKFMLLFMKFSLNFALILNESLFHIFFSFLQLLWFVINQKTMYMNSFYFFFLFCFYYLHAVQPLTWSTRWPSILTVTVNGQTFEFGPNTNSHCLSAGNFSPANNGDDDSIISCCGLFNIQYPRLCLQKKKKKQHKTIIKLTQLHFYFKSWQSMNFLGTT